MYNVVDAASKRIIASVSRGFSCNNRGRERISEDRAGFLRFRKDQIDKLGDF